MKISKVILFSLIIVSIVSCSDKSGISKPEAGHFKNIKLRSIGPGAVGGRISEILVHPENDSIIYVAASTGGIFKSVDNCSSWIPVFDHAGKSLAIGDMDISKNNPDLIWCGTGEASGEQNPASIGDGIYKSEDAGSTWKYMGLEGSRHFSKVIVHPGNDDIVFAGATGSRWGTDNERGVYRTMDGGKVWEQVLFINENTGISDIVVHPDGNTVLASAWEQRRNAWAHVRQGKSSGLYRSDDTGNSWIQITEGLPGGKAGRIALAIAESNPDIVYACYEHDSLGLFRSEDRGLTWENINNKVSTSYWYGRIYVDPTNAEHIFVMGTYMQESFDGGVTFALYNPGREVHVDHHILWINPRNTDHRLLGNDGGLYRTYKENEDWTFIANLPLGQYYDISTDNRDPYWIYGGLQDNGVWGGPSRSANRIPVSNQDIEHISGGDGFYSATDPEDNNIVYSESQYGVIGRYDHNTRKRKMIRPVAEENDPYRFNWNTPFFISVHKPHELYIGAQKVLMSNDGGEKWEEISNDLTGYFKLDSLTVIGEKPVLKPYFTITALAESPLSKGLIYAGTDDGKLFITRDQGGSWEDLSDNIPAPSDRFFTRIIASSHIEGRAYIGFGRFYEANDLRPYIYVTNDYGQSWQYLGEGLPEISIIRSIAEHHDNPDLLFTGTHNSLYMSIDGGNTWICPETNLPHVAVDDIIIQKSSNDLILGSYGRGIWILDDIGFLSSLDTDILNSDIFLFEPGLTEFSTNGQDRDADSTRYHFLAPDPEEGLVISYYLKKDYQARKRKPSVLLLDHDGNETAVEGLTFNRGFNRIVVRPAIRGNYDIVLRAGKKESKRNISIN